MESLIHADQARRIAAFESAMLKALDSGQMEMTDGELMRDDFLEVLEERHAELLRDKAQSSEAIPE